MIPWGNKYAHNRGTIGVSDFYAVPAEDREGGPKGQQEESKLPPVVGE
jgi:hypothetical protein